jgi:ribosomal protein L11 methyltransferase
MLSEKPYDDLYIYFLDGILSDSEAQGLGSHFIGNWVEENSSFLFFSAPADGPVARLLKNKPRLRLADQYFFTYDDWQGGGLETLKIGAFLVVPPWLEENLTEGAIKILLDPGVVFGNCLHPTTRTCLEALSLMAEQRPLGRVLDLGTGTGILAIAAIRLGAESALAVDFNPLCVKTAAANFHLNGLSERAKAVQGRAEEFAKKPADLVLANIQYDVVQEFLNRNRAVVAGQTLIISGQMRSQTRDLKLQLKTLGYRTLREWDHDMTWFTVWVEKP